MKLTNAKVFIDGKFTKTDLTIENGIICDIGTADTAVDNSEDEIIDCTGKMIWPGLFDIHTHGCLGYDFSKSSPSEMSEMCSFYAKHGVTSILATTMTNEFEQYERAMRYIGDVTDRQARHKDCGESTIRGINMEGPFFGPKKKGAHDEQYLRHVSQELFDSYQELSGNAIRLVDIDPSLPDALTFIRDNSKNVTVSIAHTACNYETAKAAAAAGATHVTHLFNAMEPLLHREPGVVGAAFDNGLNAEIICDGIHIHPAIIRFMFAAMPDRMILISDSINPTGLPDGNYIAGGMPIRVTDGRAFLENGTLAGSTITLFDAVTLAVSFGIPLERALLSATLIPAKAVGLDRELGSISDGMPADFLIVNNDLELEKVFIGGEKAYDFSE